MLHCSAYLDFKNGKRFRVLTISCLHNTISYTSHICIFMSFFFMQYILGLYSIIFSSCTYSQISPFIPQAPDPVVSLVRCAKKTVWETRTAFSSNITCKCRMMAWTEEREKKGHFCAVNVDPSRPILADLYWKSVCWNKDTHYKRGGCKWVWRLSIWKAALLKYNYSTHIFSCQELCGLHRLQSFF